MLFSIITPTYNRAELVCESIISYLDFIRACGVPAEIIVVDDASTDHTLQNIRQKFAAELTAGTVKLITLPQNSGWTNARNAGIRQAQGDWVIFSDSDDLFNSNAASEFLNLLERHANTPVIFTRCSSRTFGTLVGPAQDADMKVDYKFLLNHGTFGECMPIIKRHIIQAIDFNPNWQGFEALTYALQLQTYGAGVISPVVVRIYGDDPNGDRLSLIGARIRRARSMVKGNYAILKHFFWQLNMPGKISAMSRLLFYLPFYPFTR